MKKILLFLSILLAGAVMVSAEEIAPGEYDVMVVNRKQSGTPYQSIALTFWYDTPSAASYTEIYGIKAGAPFGVGAPVYGLEASVLGSLTDTVYGVQTSLIMCKAKEVTGLQFSIVNMVDSMTGLQLGVVNCAKDKSFQIGIFNYLENSSLFPFLPIFNFKF